jgi:hypothetical protein
MSVCLCIHRHLVLNLFPFPLTAAQLLSDGLPIKGWAANCLLAALHFLKYFFVCSTII